MPSPAKPLPAPSSNLIGACWALLAVGLFTLLFTVGRLTGGDVPALQIMSLRYVGGLATLLAWWLCRGAPAGALATRQPGRHFLRALSGSLGTTAALYAATHMPIASASAIGLLDGLFTALLGVIVLRERTSARLWLATFICLTGAMTVVWAQGGAASGAGMLLPALVALAGALLIALESLMLKMLARSESALGVLFYVNLFAALLLAVPAALTWHPLEPWQAAVFLLLGPFSLGAMLCNIRAFRLCDAAVLGPLRYSWIVYGLLFGWVLFGETPSQAALAGAALVILGGVWLALLRRPG